MALADLFKLHDPALVETFKKKPYEASKDRKAFIKSLEAITDQMEKGRTKVPNRMWSIANEIVELKPNYKGRPISIMGEDTFYIPQNHIEEAIETIKKAVEAGELDDALQGSEGQGGSPAVASKPKGSRKSTPQGSLNIRVGGFRRNKKNPMSDDQIRKVLTEEGISAEMIEIALAPKGKK